MNRKKANSILAAFVFGTSLLMLCSFGVDAAYVILSRNKLQKITEAIALEYVSTKALDYGGNIETDTERDKVCEDISNRYESIYNVMGTGILVFNIESMEYKIDTANNEAVVRVITTSRVLPAFLRFIGVEEILVHSRACAKTERIKITQKLNRDSGLGIGSLRRGTYTNANTEDITYTIFENPFEDDTKTANIITAKKTGKGDFMIQVDYDGQSASTGLGYGGFYIFGAYKGMNSTTAPTHWVDISDKAIEGSYSSFTSTCQAGTCFNCILGNQDEPVAFELSEDIDEAKGQINRLTDIKIYRSGSLTAEGIAGGITNPCDNQDLNPMNAAVSFGTDADVTLTILNNASLIKNSEYEVFSASGEDNTTGACR